MLPIETKNRILGAFPSAFRIINSTGGRYQYGISKWWSHEDHDHDYPELVLDPASQAVTRPEDSPADDNFGRQPSTTNPTVEADTYRGRAVLDEWTATVVCRGYENGLSANARAEVFADVVYEWITRHGHALGEAGTTNQIPVILDCYGGITNTSDMVDDALVEARSISLQLKYVSAYADTVEYVAGYEGEARSGGESVTFSVSVE